MEQLEEVDYHIYREFEVLNKVGKGTYGVVYRARHKRTQQIVAIKKIIDAFQNPIDAKRTYRELNYLLQLHHPNIIRLHHILPPNRRGQPRQPNTSRLTVASQPIEEQRGSTTDKLLPNPSAPRHLYAVFQLMEKDLSQVLKQCENIQSIQRKYIAYQMMQGIAFLHQSGLIHRDIKPSNLLINCSTLETKICDFGMARLKNEQRGKEEGVLTEYVASRWYRPPEILLGINVCQEAIDLWSAGCVLAELVSRQPIFPGKNTLDQLELIFRAIGMPSQEEVNSLQQAPAQFVIRNFTFSKSKRCKYPSFQQTLVSAEPTELDLIQRLLKFNPSSRLTAEQVLKHPYFDQVRDLYPLPKTDPAQILENPVTMDSIGKNMTGSVDYYRMLVNELQKYGERSTDRSLPKISELNREQPSNETELQKEKSTKESGCVRLMNTILEEEKKSIKSGHISLKNKKRDRSVGRGYSNATIHGEGKKSKESILKIGSRGPKIRQPKAKECNKSAVEVIQSPKNRSNTVPERSQSKKKPVQRVTSHSGHKQLIFDKSRSKKELKLKIAAEIKPEKTQIAKKLVRPAKGSKAVLSKCSSKKFGSFAAHKL